MTTNLATALPAKWLRWYRDMVSSNSATWGPSSEHSSDTTQMLPLGLILHINSLKKSSWCIVCGFDISQLSNHPSWSVYKHHHDVILYAALTVRTRTKWNLVRSEKSAQKFVNVIFVFFFFLMYLRIFLLNKLPNLSNFIEIEIPDVSNTLERPWSRDGL